MEDSTHRDFKSPNYDVSLPGQNSDSNLLTDSPPAAARIHNFGGTLKQQSSAIQKSLDLSVAQPPDEGHTSTNSSTHKDKAMYYGAQILNVQGERDSELYRELISHDEIEDDYQDTELSLHPLRLDCGQLESIVNVPLAKEENACPSLEECNVSSLVAPLVRDEATGYESNKIHDYTPVLIESSSVSNGDNVPTPRVIPALLTDAPAEQNNLVVRNSATRAPTVPTDPDRDTLLCHLQTGPPQNNALQPPSFSKLLYKTLIPFPDPNKISNTPPPSYQESLSYPVIQHQPLPTYASAVGAGSTCPHLGSTTKNPVVSIIRLSSPPATRPTSVSEPGTRDNVFVWHSPSDEMCTRDNQAQEQYSDHQILALLACIMFWPVGLLAIYYANMANILRSEGVHAKSLIYSKRALLLSLVSFMIGTGVYLTFYLQRKITL